jgi:hypothetical protein
VYQHQQIKPDLAAIRSIVVERIDEAMVRAQRLASPDVSIPSSLLAAALWIADQAEFPTCDGEAYFGWPPQAQLRYLYRLTPEQRAQELAAGARVLFEGSARRAPLVDLSLTDVAGDPARNFSNRKAA